jgi:hypothetical protein
LQFQFGVRFRMKIRGKKQDLCLGQGIIKQVEISKRG